MHSVSLRPLRHLGMAAALLAPAAGCSKATGARRSLPSATVAFVNQGLEEASVYAIGMGGEWYRVGTVSAGQSARLRIPSSLVASGRTINFVARPLATSRLATSGPITISAGDSLTITMPPSQNILSVLPGLP